MSAPFAALESRVNASVLAKLSNADALIDGVSVRGIFDWRREGIEYGLDEARPVFTCSKSTVPDGATDVMIGTDSYVISAIRDDGTGIVELMLTGPA